MTDTAPAPVTLRALAAPVFLPSLLFGIGQGAIAPVVVVSARDLGASIAVAGLIAALAGFGNIIADVPAGALAARLGERRTMIAATVALAGALVMCALAPSLWLLGVGITLTGFARAAWGLARHTYVTEAVPYELRARALSTLGGTQRIGMFIGPFVGAAAMTWAGTEGAYWVHLVTAVAAVGVLLAVPSPPGADEADRPKSKAEHGGTLKVLREHFPTFRTLGVGAMLVGALRSVRPVVIPLWAEYLGLDPAATSIVFGLASAIDMAMFYPAGKIMDRYGRVWVAVPCMLVMAVSLFLLPLTHNAGTLLAVAMLMGFGNGIGSGIIMTLGADASPDVGRANFLGGWRLCSDLGNAGGPLLVSGIAAVATLGPAILAMGVVGMAGAGALAKWIPRRS
ncbi:MFS transporter [Phytomonospora endophytica]|uniref:MFS family permease n=1 Tax=Phytomonospora endophytica TaxID=714109 RepID=A0A841FQG7_9ACTN|nr:MFS transporter [Phytomonospora endophytica]MBB6035802.1 MFS family permease [Phytomonospora endophytica]GIG69527.1 MFS transporter [Phytomonospora endophytica]